jgi:hypothetical protein
MPEKSIKPMLIDIDTHKEPVEMVEYRRFSVKCSPEIS